MKASHPGDSRSAPARAALRSGGGGGRGWGGLENHQGPAERWPCLSCSEVQPVDRVQQHGSAPDEANLGADGPPLVQVYVPSDEHVPGVGGILFTLVINRRI